MTSTAPPLETFFAFNAKKKGDLWHLSHPSKIFSFWGPVSIKLTSQSKRFTNTTLCISPFAFHTFDGSKQTLQKLITSEYNETSDQPPILDFSGATLCYVDNHFKKPVVIQKWDLNSIQTKNHITFGEGEKALWIRDISVKKTTEELEQEEQRKAKVKYEMQLRADRLELQKEKLKLKQMERRIKLEKINKSKSNAAKSVMMTNIHAKLKQCLEPKEAVMLTDSIVGEIVNEMVQGNLKNKKFYEVVAYASNLLENRSVHINAKRMQYGKEQIEHFSKDKYNNNPFWDASDNYSFEDSGDIYYDIKGSHRYESSLNDIDIGGYSQKPKMTTERSHLDRYNNDLAFNGHNSRERYKKHSLSRNITTRTIQDRSRSRENRKKTYSPETTSWSPKSPDSSPIYNNNYYSDNDNDNNNNNSILDARRQKKIDKSELDDDDDEFMS